MDNNNQAKKPRLKMALGKASFAKTAAQKLMKMQSSALSAAKSNNK